MTKVFTGDFRDFDKFTECHRLGIFDSGVGGLSIIKYIAGKKHIVSKQDNKDILYVADNARFPYGSKSSHQIFTYTKQIVIWLEKQEVDLILFGCNTASAIAGEYIGKNTKVPVINLVDPVAHYVSQLGLRVSILATQATVRSHAFSQAIHRYAPFLAVQEIAAPDLVDLVENGLANSEITKRTLSKYCDLLAAENTEILILSCTHFSFLKDTLSQLVGNKIQIIDPGELIANLVMHGSMSNDLLEQSTMPALKFNSTFYVTGDVRSFADTANKCLGYSIKNINHLSLSELESLTTV